MLNIRNFKLKDLIYHGTIYDIKVIDLTKGKGFKDFGKGFYLAYNRNQALGMANKKLRETSNIKRKQLRKRIYTFSTNSNVLNNLNVKIFYQADMEWLDFVLVCRSYNYTPHNYDVVIGPTADDNTNVCFNSYKEGMYGPVGSIRAKSLLLNNLEVDKLGTQVFIGTERGKSILKDWSIDYVD